MEHNLVGRRVKITHERYKGQTGKITSAHPVGIYDPNLETFIVKYDGEIKTNVSSGMFTVFEFEVLDEEPDGKQKKID
jgi:hypothetical protein